MNSRDIKLIGGLILLVLVMFGLVSFTKKTGLKKANVYYQNDLILSVLLYPNKQETHVVKGYNGEVVIEIDNERIRVKEETSPLHLCSKQGWIKEAYETIICLPNKIVIEIEATTDLDALIE